MWRVVGLRGSWRAAEVWFLLKESECLRRGEVIASVIDPRIVGMSETAYFFKMAQTQSG